MKRHWRQPTLFPWMIPALWAVLIMGGYLFGGAVDGGSSAAEISRRLDRDLYGLIQEARASGATEAEILEHRALRALQMDDLDALASLARELEAVDLPFGEGHLLRNDRERDGFSAAVRALFFQELADDEAFLEAAAQARAEAPLWSRRLGVDELLKERKQREGGQTLPLDLSLGKMGGGEVSLGTLLEGRKGLLLDFWASWCGPCMRAMPELKERAAAWRPRGLEVAGVNTDHDQQTTHAKKTYERFELDMPWLLEPDTDPIAGPLGIDSIPRVILLDPTGTVLFNGHPRDVELKLALSELGIDPSLTSSD